MSKDILLWAWFGFGIWAVLGNLMKIQNPTVRAASPLTYAIWAVGLAALAGLTLLAQLSGR